MIITVKHNFETAHRLPFLPGKCENLHGHSWWAEFMIEAPMDADGLTVEYGTIKKKIRGWIDEHLDHGAMLGAEDKLLPAFIEDGSKVFVFGDNNGYAWLPWPTVEAVAEMLAGAASLLVPANSAVILVEVQETHVNKAIWRYNDESE